MKPVLFRFYRYSNCLTGDGKSLDLKKIMAQHPLGSLKARPEVIFRTHMRHLAFAIARNMPGLEGRHLDVELQFQGSDGAPKLPVLVALHHGEVVGKQLARLHTLNIDPFLAVLLQRNPELQTEELLFTVNPEEGAIP